MMKYFDENGNIIRKQDADLSKGILMESTRIRDDAPPVDNVTKFAWEDGDYEDCMIYVCQEPELSTPTQLDMVDAQSAWTAMITNTRLEDQMQVSFYRVASLNRHSRDFERIKRWYQQRLWNLNMIKTAAEKGIINQNEYKEIASI